MGNITFFGSPGNLFNCVGKCGLVLKQEKADQTAQLPNLTNTTTGLVAQLSAESDIQAIVGDNYISTLNTLGDVVGNVASQVWEQIVNRVVFRANPLLGITLTNTNTVLALEEIIFQMQQQGQTVQKCTVTGTANAVAGQPGPYFIGNGNGVLNVSVVRPSDSRNQENLYAETLTLICTSDSYTGGATAGNETFSSQGVGNESDFFAFDWPLGSNSNISTSAIDGDTDNGSGNLLTNSGFASFTSNVPANWTVEAGVAGTNILQNTGTTYSGGSSLQITGSAGNPNTKISQTFNSTSGTGGDLDPITQYSFCLFIRRDGVVPAAGVLQIDITDNLGNILTDSGGTNQSFQIALTGLTTSFVPYTGVFRTPLVMNATSYKIRYWLSTPLTNGRTVYVGKTSLGVFSRQYVGGPSVAVHSGSVPFTANDQATATFTNDRGGAADGVSTFQTVFLRCSNGAMLSNNLLLGSSATPTISDSLIA